MYGLVSETYEKVPIEIRGEEPEIVTRGSQDDIKFSPSVGRSYELLAESHGHLLMISRIDFDITYRGSSKKELE